jgi:hypothetical protein
VTLVKREKEPAVGVHITGAKNASDTLGRQDLLPSHQLPVKPSVTVKTGLGGQVTKR